MYYRRAPGVGPSGIRGTVPLQQRRYWFEVNGTVDYVEGSFKRVTNLCDALHEKLGRRSTCAMAVGVAVRGSGGEYVEVSKICLCTEVNLTGATLSPYAPDAWPLHVTYIPPEALSNRALGRNPLGWGLAGFTVATAAPATEPRKAETKRLAGQPPVLHAIKAEADDAPVDTTMPAVVASVPPLPPSATKRSRTVTLPPPTEREIEVSALRKSKRALMMGETPAAAALSVEALRDICVLGPDNDAWAFCHAVADSIIRQRGGKWTVIKKGGTLSFIRYRTASPVVNPCLSSSTRCMCVLVPQALRTSFQMSTFRRTASQRVGQSRLSSKNA
jgi:hypothetical protein